MCVVDETEIIEDDLESDFIEQNKRNARKIINSLPLTEYIKLADENLLNFVLDNKDPKFWLSMGYLNPDNIGQRVREYVENKNKPAIEEENKQPTKPLPDNINIQDEIPDPLERFMDT